MLVPISIFPFLPLVDEGLCLFVQHVVIEDPCAVAGTAVFVSGRNDDLFLFVVDIRAVSFCPAVYLRLELIERREVHLLSFRLRKAIDIEILAGRIFAAPFDKQSRMIVEVHIQEDERFVSQLPDVEGRSVIPEVAHVVERDDRIPALSGMAVDEVL